MKEDLSRLLNECMEHATEEDLHSLRQLLTGMRKKQEDGGPLLGGVFAMEWENEEDTLTLSIPITPLTHNSLGIVHGGITATMVDTIMGTLANRALPSGYGAVTTYLNVHYLAPGTGGELTAKGQIIHHGTKTMVVEGKVLRSDGKVIAHSTGSFFIFKK
ncbi:PaaI family thioesterase [Rossellomorea marisflavi]|uniref:PaaI family thioesterase n=1 Tax=Rossellomorea marisflavi TaxID=189381 RepID=UPI00064F1252|nr:PaaI family thioesterase [Rossellomorea marisflavi]KMK96628.1 thioesterase [Rossellomorea marisflavi]KML32995.1 thioesterase [Rossellomorea marisflavi]